jgi:hypothetical protein
VRSRAFLIGTVAAPLLLGGILLLPALMRRASTAGRCAWPCSTPPDPARPRGRGPVPQKLDGAARFWWRGPKAARREEAARLKRDVLTGRLDGYIYLPPDALELSSAEYFGRNVSNLVDLRLMDGAIEEVMEWRGRLAGAGPRLRARQGAPRARWT